MPINLISILKRIQSVNPHSKSKFQSVIYISYFSVITDARGKRPNCVCGISLENTNVFHEKMATSLKWIVKDTTLKHLHFRISFILIKLLHVTFKIYIGYTK